VPGIEVGAILENVLGGWTVQEALLFLGGKLVKALVIILLAVMLIRFTNRLIEKFFQEAEEEGREYRFFERRRVKTLVTIINSIFRYAIYFMAGISLLSVFVDEAGRSVLAGALAGVGIVGLAVGFGAQNLVRDVITGFFIVFEDQFSVGDYVTIGNVSGIVEEMGLRVTKLRDFTGELHIVPNGLIEQTTNHNRGPMRVWIEVGIAYEEDIDHAIAVMEEALEKARAEIDTIMEGPKVLGVQSLADSSVVIAVWAKTVPMEQWAVGRELRKRLKQALDAAGIEIPYPRQVFVPPSATKIGRPSGGTGPTEAAGGEGAGEERASETSTSSRSEVPERETGRRRSRSRPSPDPGPGTGFMREGP